MPRFLFLAAVLFLLPFQGGCLFPYCVYPKLDVTPSVKLDAPPYEVHAFRVDISRPTGDMDVFVGPVYERLSEVPASKTGEIPAQFKPSVTRGFVVIGGALNFLTYTSYSVALRLYRPGYELVEVHSWESVHRLPWKPAPDLETQEKSLEKLLPVKLLEPGGKSPGHRDALLFGAAEYDRLAKATRSEDQRTRLTTKANQLRELAKKEPYPVDLPNLIMGSE